MRLSSQLFVDYKQCSMAAIIKTIQKTVELTICSYLIYKKLKSAHALCNIVYFK